MPLQNIMVDIEALGLRTGAAIIDLAAVAFNPVTAETGAEFHCRIKPASPFVCDFETIGWHGQQGTMIDHPDAILPQAAVILFMDWIDATIPDSRERTFWSWGSDYDFPLLDPLLDLRPADRAAPWLYFQTRCARTAWRLAFGREKPMPRPHEALADVRAAIRDLSAAFAKLGITDPVR